MITLHVVVYDFVSLLEIDGLDENILLKKAIQNNSDKSGNWILVYIQKVMEKKKFNDYKAI